MMDVFLILVLVGMMVYLVIGAARWAWRLDKRAHKEEMEKLERLHKRELAKINEAFEEIAKHLRKAK